MNRKTKTAAEKIIARIRKQKGARHAATIVAFEKARVVAHGGWEGAMSGVMQLPSDTAEERTYNVEQLETLLDAWRAFCHVYSDTYESLRVSM